MQLFQRPLARTNFIQQGFNLVGELRNLHKTKGSCTALDAVSSAEDGIDCLVIDTVWRQF